MHAGRTQWPGWVDCNIVEFRQGILEPQRWLNCVDAVGRERGSGNQHCGGGDGSVEGVSVEVAAVTSWGRHVARAASTVGGPGSVSCSGMNGNNIVCMHVQLACACVHACVLYESLDRRRESKRD